MSESHWTKTPPTQPGHYWISLDSARRFKTVVQLEFFREKLQCFEANAWHSLNDKHYWSNIEWWPIPLQEPPDDYNGMETKASK